MNKIIKIVFTILVIQYFSLPLYAENFSTINKQLKNKDIPSLDLIFNASKIKYKKETIGFLFETGGGDPAYNGNLLYLLFINYDRNSLYENNRQVFYIDNIQTLKKIIVEEKDTIRLTVDSDILTNGYFRLATYEIKIKIQSKNDTIAIKKKIINKTETVK